MVSLSPPAHCRRSGRTLTGHWAADAAAYDKVQAGILDMSQMLGTGFINQFPDRF